jgi:Mn2+/Fe2+ NRAMP family transporter
VPLVLLTRSRSVMADLANSRRTNVMAYVVTALIIGLNLLLLYQFAGGKF